MFSHTVRDLCKDVFQAWVSIHKEASEMACAKKLFPTCCSGRWNSVDGLESRLEEIGGQPMMHPVLRYVLMKKAPNVVIDIELQLAGKYGDSVISGCGSSGNSGGCGASSSSSTANAEVPISHASAKAKAKAKAKATAQASQTMAVDDLAVEATKQHTAKMGKYRKQTFACSADVLWWATARVMRCTRAPVLHLSVPCILLALSSQQTFL